MRHNIQINSTKTISLPSRMFKPKDLKDMGVDYVEKKALFNLTKIGKPILHVDAVAAEHMTIIHYRDFSNKEFSLADLLKYIDEQLELSADVIFLPHFKDETDYDIREKIRVAGELKQKLDLKIILEISYKCEIKSTELADFSASYDFISVYYGTYYGGYPSLEKVVTRIMEIKHLTGKKVFCTAVPLKFSGATRKDVRFMPCFDLICDGWVKNWKQARGPAERKVIDPKDLKSKSYIGWLETGHKSGEKLLSVNRTVFELFNRSEKSVVEHFQREIEDEILTEVHNLDPNNIDNYVFNKFHPQYVGLILPAYRIKLIVTLFREDEVFSRFSKEELSLLEGKVREQHSTAHMFDEIVFLADLARTSDKITVPAMIEQINLQRTKF